MVCVQIETNQTGAYWLSLGRALNICSEATMIEAFVIYVAREDVIAVKMKVHIQCAPPYITI